jgi:acyl-CoA thioesterase FadM
VSSRADFPYVRPVTVTPADGDVQGHLNNVAAVRLFQDLRVQFVLERLAPGAVALYDDVVVVVADQHVHYASQGSLDETYTGGLRVLGRTDKAYCYDEILWAGERVVARCRLVELFVSRSTGRVMTLPDEFVERLSAAAGRSVPHLTELPLPRLAWDDVP